MKTLLMIPVLSLSFMNHEKPLRLTTAKHDVTSIASKEISFSNSSNNQPEPSGGNMSYIIFKNQEYCRVELKDFEFDAPFNVVSATVLFSGTNFKYVETGYIKSNSLLPLKDLMKRCAPGTIVVFDEVKVKGPDNQVRPIAGATFRLF
jgi:hypothetical protein